MEWTQLENGVKMPLLGLGTWRLAGSGAEDAVRQAIGLGYRHIDTAAMYGNEEAVGRAVRQSGVPREEIFVTTKLWTEDVRRGRAREALMESLSRLGMDYVDLYLIHWPAEGYQKAWQVMTDLYHEGWCRAIGVANFEEDHLASLCGVSDMKPLVDQFESHPTFGNGAVLAACAARHIQPVAYSPLGRGEDLAGSDTLRRLAKKYGRTPAQIALRWALQRGMAVIPKTARASRMEENSQIFDFKLRRKDMEAVSAMETGHRLSADPHHFTF